MSEQEPRPGQATLAGGLIIGGSLVVVVSAWERIATLNTLEVQRELERWLQESNLDGSMGVEGLSTGLRVLCLVGAAAAAAAAVLGIEVFKRSTSARIALTALSPLLLVGGTATAGLLAPAVLLGIALLWSQPTRDWYAGRPWVAAEQARREARARRFGPPPGAARSTSASGGPAGPAGPAGPTAGTAWPPPPPAPGAHGTPPPPPGYGPPAPGYGPPAAGHGYGYGQAPTGYGQPRPRGPRPTSLLTACVLAWVGSTVTAVALGLSALAIGEQRAELYAQVVRDQPRLAEQLSERDVVAVMYVVIAGLVVWCLGAVVLAGLAFVGHNWARITLAVSAITAGVLALLSVLAAPPVLLVVVVLVASARLLLRPDAAAWCRERR